jgi:hypothetical protein
LDKNFQADGYGYFDDEETRDSKSSFVKFIVKDGIIQVLPADGTPLEYPGPVIDRVEIHGLEKDLQIKDVRVVGEYENDENLHFMNSGNKWVVKLPNLSSTDTTWRMHFQVATAVESVEIRIS